MTFTFIKETAEAWIYEGLAIPYGGPANGQDLTGSHFTKDTDLCLDWFPDGGRPLLYRHGFDATLKTNVIGRETGAVREDSKGRWYQLQIDKAKEYAAEVKQLADEGVLSLSSGAVDHLSAIAAKTGEITKWPWVELSLVPNPANPEALVYKVKSVDAVEHLTIVGTPEPEAMKDTVLDETVAGEAGPELIIPLGAEDILVVPLSSIVHLPEPVAVASTDALKAGARNSAADLTNIQAIHDAAKSLGAACKDDADEPDDSNDDDADKSLDGPVARLVITGTAAAKEVDLAALTVEMSKVATLKAQEILRR